MFELATFESIGPSIILRSFIGTRAFRSFSRLIHVTFVKASDS